MSAGLLHFKLVGVAFLWGGTWIAGRIAVGELPALASVVFLGLFGTALGFTWYADGVMRLGATRAGLYINLVPVFAVLQGALLLGERVGAASLAGGLLVIAGVLLATLQRGAPAARKPA